MCQPTGRAFFQELDRDGDERVTLDDLKAAMRHRNLPEQFAVEFLRAARGNRWWSNSIMYVRAGMQFSCFHVHHCLPPFCTGGTTLKL